MSYYQTLKAKRLKEQEAVPLVPMRRIIFPITENYFEYFEEHEKFIPKLPEYEQTLVEYYMRRMKQQEIATFLGCTQGAISSRLRKIVKRISFMEKLERFNLNQIEQDLKPICHKPYCVVGKGPKKWDDLDTRIDLEVIKGMIQTTSQSGTATIVNDTLNLSGPKKMNQVKVRNRFKNCLTKLKGLSENPLYKNYLELLEMIDHNLYVLHEVKHPRFERGVI